MIWTVDRWTTEATLEHQNPGTGPIAFGLLGRALIALIAVGFQDKVWCAEGLLNIK